MVSTVHPVTVKLNAFVSICSAPCLSPGDEQTGVDTCKFITPSPTYLFHCGIKRPETTKLTSQSTAQSNILSLRSLHCHIHWFFTARSSVTFNPHGNRWSRSQRILRFCERSACISSTLVFLSSFIDTAYKNGPCLPELQTCPSLFYFSPTCFHWGLITWWTE